MQGTSTAQEKQFFSFHLSERIPRGNFYRCLMGDIDLDILYLLTKGFNDYWMGTRKKEHRTREHVFTDCPIRSSCFGKSVPEKKFSVTYYC